MDKIMDLAVSQGLGYALFVFLFVYVLKTTGEREKKYQDIIEKLTEKFNIVEIVQQDVKEVKDFIFKK
jgi:hypothetical protein